jgi:error-prone DNA polymerase
VVAAKFQGFSSIGLIDRNGGRVVRAAAGQGGRSSYHRLPPGFLRRHGCSRLSAGSRGLGHLCRMLTQANLRDENERGLLCSDEATFSNGITECR